MTTLCIIQVRIGSTRLPGKALLPIAGKPMFQHLVEQAPWPKIVTCPTTDYAIIDILRDIEVPYSTSRDVDNVLGRFILALKKAREYYGIDFKSILRLTADCPMLTEPIISRFIKACDHDPETLYTNRHLDPDGMDMELFTPEALYMADQASISAYDREHVTPIMYSILNVKRLRVTLYDPRIKISVDTRDEYLLVKSTMEGRVK